VDFLGACFNTDGGDGYVIATPVVNPRRGLGVSARRSSCDTKVREDWSVMRNDSRARRPLAERTLTRTLERAVEQRPEHLALSDDTTSLTYAATWEEAQRISAGYQFLGLGRQEPMLLMLDSHIDSALAWIGLSFTAAMETLVNTAYKGKFLSHLVNDSRARSAVVEEHYLSQLLEAAGDTLETVIVRPTNGSDLAPVKTRNRECSRAKIVPFAELRAHSPIGPAHVDPWDLIAILYTSGTTGVSKGALLAHAGAYTTAEFTGRQGPDDVRFVVAPQFHVAGQWGGVYRALIPGSTAHIASGFHATTFWDEARRVQATTTQMVGTMAEFLLRRPPRPDDEDNPIREVYMTPVTADLKTFRQRFDVEVVTGFGSTEAGTILIDDEPDQVAPGRCGRPHPDVEVRLVDEHDIEVDAGEVGEAVVRPKVPWTVMVQWHGLPEQSADAWRNGWLHSGDALRQDEDGVYHFVDRVVDAIRRRGENVSSFEVELAVVGHPEVSEAAAIAVDSEYSEDEIKVFVIRQEGSTLTEEALIRYLAYRMPYFMVPRYVEFVGDLPRTPTQKVQKTKLKATGVGSAWDREAAGIVISRSGISRLT
jgi:crotonobetaine/carnitine-CoA ligase